MGKIRLYYHYYICYYFLVSLSIVVTAEGETETEEKNCFSSNPAPKKKLIIDTDVGADDGVAILNILGAEQLFQNMEVQLISAVFGNTHVDNVARNVLKVLKTMNRLDIPVYKGANQSLVRTPKTENYFGEDGFGDFNFPNPPSEDLIKKVHAVNALINEAELYSGQLVLICLGPLTNIALATRLDTKFFDNLKEIYVLGGSDSGIGNIRPGVEYNFHVDPEAALIVLKEAEKKNKIIHLVSWETVAVRTTIDMKWRKYVLGAMQSPQVDLINKAENKTLKGKNWISADAVLSSVVIDGGIVTVSDIYHADVETCGEHSRAAMFIDYNNSTDRKKNIRIIKKINPDLYKRMLLQNLNAQVGENTGA